MNNEAKIVGCIKSEFSYSHEVQGEIFYSVKVLIKRDSGNTDTIPVIISERLFNIRENYLNKYVYIKGQLRTYNQHVGGKTHLILFMFAIDIELIDEEYNINDVFLNGYLCKKPVYRRTPLGREIADVLLAVNREHGKSDYIPCVCWGRNAKYVSTLNIGDAIRVAGRVQSREYNKNGEIKIAYELSVSLLENS